MTKLLNGCLLKKLIYNAMWLKFENHYNFVIPNSLKS